MITHEIVERKVGDLMVDPTVQRTIKQSRVRRMLDEGFDPQALGVLTTSYRRAKEIHIVDGQHRYALMQAAGYDGVITTNQYKGLALPDEAALFRKLNTAEKPSAIDGFRIRKIEGDQDVVDMFTMLERHGWQVLNSAQDGSFGAVVALERAWKRDKVAAERAIVTLTAAYGHKVVAVHGPLVDGLSAVLARYGDAINLNDLSAKLTAIAGGPTGLVGFARGRQVTGGSKLAYQVAAVIVDTYNSRRRSTALPPWSS